MSALIPVEQLVRSMAENKVPVGGEVELGRTAIEILAATIWERALEGDIEFVVLLLNILEPGLNIRRPLVH